jgi:hypothetical protein
LSHDNKNSWDNHFEHPVSAGSTGDQLLPRGKARQ